MIAPIAIRELLVSSRRPANWRVRLAMTLSALIVCFFVLTGSRSVTSAGATLFYVLGFLAFLYALTAGFIFTADAIIEERREGTFGLLYLTPLKSWEVITGKLASTSLQAIYGLVAIIPILSLSLLAGGVTAQQLLRIVAILIATLCLSLAAGMFASAGAQSRRGAFGLTMMLVFAPVVGGWIGVMVASVLAYISEQEKKRSANLVWFAGYATLTALLIYLSTETAHGLIGSPAQAYSAVFHPAIPPRTFVIFVVALLGTTVFYIFSASLCTEWYRTAREIVAESEENEHAVDDLFFPGMRVRGPVGDDPARWLLSFLQTQPFLFYIAFAFMLLVNLASGSAPIGGMNFFFAFSGMLPVLVMTFTLGKFCGTPFHLLQRSGFNETLLSTPLRTESLVREQRRNFWQMLRLPLLFLVLASVPASLFFLMQTLRSSGGLSAAGTGLFCVSWLLGWAVFFVQLEGLATISMQFAVQGQKPPNAAIRSIGIVFVPSFFLTTFVPMLYGFPIARSGSTERHFTIVLLCQALSGGFVLWWLHRSRRKLGLSAGLLRP